MADPDSNQTATILDNTDEGSPYLNIQFDLNFISNYCCGFDSAKPNIFENPNHICKIGKNELVSNYSKKDHAVIISSDLKFSAHVVCAAKHALMALEHDQDR